MRTVVLDGLVDLNGQPDIRRAVKLIVKSIQDAIENTVIESCEEIQVTGPNFHFEARFLEHNDAKQLRDRERGIGKHRRTPKGPGRPGG